MIGYDNHNSQSDAAQFAYVQRQQRKKQSRGEAFKLAFAHITNRDSLFRAYAELKNSGGHAPGVDGLRYADLSPSEVGELVGELSNRIERGDYKPQPVRRCSIPKPGTSEKRKLHLPTILDRTVAKSLATATSPYFERVFLDRSWGFRPDRGTLKMLARLEADILATRRFVLAVADIRRAFDSVRIAGVLTAHQQLFDEDLADHIVPSDQDKILALIGATLRGHDPNKEVGIDQGNPYSPLALNVLLHTVHDVPRNADVRLPLWYRYADNLVYACHSVTDGRQVLEHIRQTHVSHNLALKGTAGVYDLRKDEEVPLLGFRIRLNRDRLCYGIGEHAYTSLREHLINAHDKPNPPEAARNSLLGWVMSMGPAVEAAEAAIKVAMDIAQRCGFREIPSHAQLLEYWQQAGETWERLRRAVRRRF